jgi:hypothetical protein
MSNGSSANTHVTKVEQRGDGTISVHIQTDSFNPTQEVEVSAYLTQGNSSSFYNDRKRIPFPNLTDLTDHADPTNSTDSKQPAELHVELPATTLDTTQPVTVVTRVTEIWSTVVSPDPDKLKQYRALLGEYGDQGIKGVWTYQDSEGKGQGDTQSQQTSNGGSNVTTTQPQ